MIPDGNFVIPSGPQQGSVAFQTRPLRRSGGGGGGGGGYSDGYGDGPLSGAAGAAPGAEVTLPPPAPDMSVGRQDQAMLLIASGIVTPLMPPWLLDRVRGVSQTVAVPRGGGGGGGGGGMQQRGGGGGGGGGGGRDGPAAAMAAVSFPNLEDSFQRLSEQGMPAPLARASASAGLNPLMRHILATAAQLDTSSRPVDLSRLVSVIGKVACNAALAVAAVSTGLFVLPSHVPAGGGGGGGGGGGMPQA